MHSHSYETELNLQVYEISFSYEKIVQFYSGLHFEAILVIYIKSY